MKLNDKKYFKDIRILIALLVFIVILLSGFLYFRNKNTKKKNKNENEDKVQKIISNAAVFKIRAEDIRVKTLVKIRYKPPERKVPIWLGFNSNKDNTISNFLVDHPIFENIDWKEINNDKYTLFQKEFRYDSVDEFIKNPPKEEKILVDPSIYEYLILKTNLTEMISKDIDPNNYSYVLTTYHKPYFEKGWKVFERVIDTTNASLDETKNITWYIEMNGVSETNPFWMNYVDVVFLQPGLIIHKPNQ